MMVNEIVGKFLPLEKSYHVKGVVANEVVFA